MAKIVGISLFVICFLAHLICCAFHLDRQRKILKCFIVTSLILMIYTLRIRNVYIYLALLWGLFGDFFLLFDKDKASFKIGIVFFGMNHIFYFLAIYSSIFYAMNKWTLIILIVIYLILSVLFIIPIKKFISKDNTLNIIGSFYLNLLIMEIVSNSIYLYHTGKILPLFGAILFFISDAYLVKCNFMKHDKHEDVIIMLTYGLAQLLLSVGIGI